MMKTNKLINKKEISICSTRDDNMGRSMVEMPGSFCHSSACAARQAVKESLLRRCAFKRTCAASESGRSMVEMLGVLAIIGVLSGAGLAGYSHAMKKHKLNQTLEEMQTIIGNVRAKFAHQSRAREIGLEQAVQLGIFPENMVKSATQVLNKYNGTVNLESADIEDKDGNTRKVYKLSFEGLPKDVAAQLAIMDWGEDSVMKLILNEVEEE